jgi:hypothetical protein
MEDSYFTLASQWRYKLSITITLHSPDNGNTFWVEQLRTLRLSVNSNTNGEEYQLFTRHYMGRPIWKKIYYTPCMTLFRLFVSKS